MNKTSRQDFIYEAEKIPNNYRVGDSVIHLPRLRKGKDPWNGVIVAEFFDKALRVFDCDLAGDYQRVFKILFRDNSHSHCTAFSIRHGYYSYLDVETNTTVGITAPEIQINWPYIFNTAILNGTSET